MIASFGDKVTEALFHNENPAQWRRLPREIVRRAAQQLDMLNAARSLHDLRSPPGNRLELLRGDLAGLHSIRVNDQWRIVFRWQGTDALEVRLTDYH